MTRNRKILMNREREEFAKQDPIYVTIVGIGYSPLKQILMQTGTILRCEKEPDNKYDHEAIKVCLPIGEIGGYIANSINTVVRGTYSAGRLYDKMGEVNYVQVVGSNKECLLGILLGDSPENEVAWKNTILDSAEKIMKYSK